MKPVSIAEHTHFTNMVTRVAGEHQRKYLMVQEGNAHVSSSGHFMAVKWI